MLNGISYQGNANQLKPQWDITLHPLGWLFSKGQIINIDKDVEKWHFSYTADGM